nr:YhcH/YjgK/YiaL family protein [Veillonella denticariosi]
MYANVDDVKTKLFEETKPESHKNYVDIQFMVCGEEHMGFFVDRGKVKPVESYPDRDCYFYPNEAVDEGMIHCPEGYYTVFFPSDIHRPLLAVNDKPIDIRKVVVKVHVSLL